MVYMKNILKLLLLFILLTLIGCGDSDQEESSLQTSTLSTQEMLDNGDYNGVINSTENSAYSNEDYLNLATAYLGLSGLTIKNIIREIYLLDNDNENSFIELTSAITQSTKSCKTPLENFDKSTQYYMKIMGDRCSQYATYRLTDSEKEICLSQGLSQIMQSVTAINYLTGDIANLLKENSKDSKLIASSCAMQYAFNGVSECPKPIKKEPLFFIETEKIYDRIVVYAEKEEFQFLLADSPFVNNVKEVIMTNGYCTLDDFSTRIYDKSSPKYNSSTYYPCPVNLTVDDILVDSFNAGVGAVIVGANTDTELIESVSKFKDEILNDTHSRDSDVKIENIVNYLYKYAN